MYFLLAARSCHGDGTIVPVSRRLLTGAWIAPWYFSPCKRDGRMVSPGSGKPFVSRAHSATLPPLFLNGRKYDKAIRFMRPSRQPIETKYVCSLWIVGCVCVRMCVSIIFRQCSTASKTRSRTCKEEDKKLDGRRTWRSQNFAHLSSKV